MALAAVGLQTSIWNNNIRSFILLAIYPLVLGAIIWAVAALYGALMTGAFNGAPDWHRAAGFGTAVIAHYWPTILAIIVIWFLIALAGHSRMIRLLAHSKPVTRLEEPALYNLLENLCISRGLTMPTLNIIETDARNAFASGIGHNSYSITVTRGLLQALKPDELEGVLAHELTHILNNDVRLMVVAVIFVGMLGFASQLLWTRMRWFLYMRPSRRDREGNQLMLFMLAVGVVLWLGYLTTLFTRLALSRRRETMADEGAVTLTKNPDAFMRALLRIENNADIPHVSHDISRMCIEEGHHAFAGLFSDHPPIADRVRRIAALTGVPVPVLDAPAAAVEQPGTLPGGRPNPWR